MSFVTTVFAVIFTLAAYAATVFGLFASVTARVYHGDDTPREKPFRLATYDDVPEWVSNEVSLEA